jgi:hypothetical protein
VTPLTTPPASTLISTSTSTSTSTPTSSTIISELITCLSQMMRNVAPQRLDRILWCWGMTCYTLWRLFASPEHYTTTRSLGPFVHETQRWSSVLRTELHRAPFDAQRCFLIITLTCKDQWMAPYMLAQTLRHRSLLTPAVRVCYILPSPTSYSSA